MKDTKTLARPYAKAAFEYAEEHKHIAEWSKILYELGAVVQVPEMTNLLGNPKVSSEQIIQVLTACLKEIPEKIKNFISTLANNQRLELLPIIAEIFEQYKAEKERTIKVHITSAYPLNESQNKQFEQILGDSLQRKVFIESDTDEKLIGGAIIRAGDQVIDGSIRGRLQQLAENLMNR